MKKSSQSSGRVVEAVAGSFRDPAGFIYYNQDGTLLRQINQAGKDDFELMNSSGLYDELAGKGLLIKHETVPLSQAADGNAYAVIRPETVPYISYPFEWSFGQLRDAALLTLDIQQKALDKGMVLKDASAYNVQFLKGRPVFIDTLSFEAYKSGEPWQAYRQFCQHFLAPLALMSYTDESLLQLLRVHLDGLPLATASALLPARAKARPGIAMHIVLHGRAQNAKASDAARPGRKVSKAGLIGIIDNLQRLVRGLKPKKSATEWADYYNNTNYSVQASDAKAALITKFLKPLGLSTAVDLGGNDGRYSRVLNRLGIHTVCTDIDPNAVDANYAAVKKHKEELMLPMLVDLTNPGGCLGWGNEEREPVHERLQSDVVLSLALIHHLAISNNLPLAKIADYYSRFGKYLVLEFVPKSDSQVKILLATREDIFPQYHEDGLKQAFGRYYDLLQEERVTGSDRTLYLFERRNESQ